jgi:hypothetical protein
MEVLVTVGILSLIGVTFMQTYALGVQVIIDSKNRLGATSLANEKMEVLRSLPYADIGTKHWNGAAWVYGVPAGEVLEEEDVAVNTRTYHVDTFVQYVDDALDGTVSTSPADAVPNDYKRVRITISWGGRSSNEQVALFGNFTPPNTETATPGGTLSINILNTAGVGVSGVNVRIQNTTASIDTTATTDSAGNILLPGTAAGSKKYVITASKTGYYGAATFPPYPTTSYTPVDTHATVVNGTLNSFSMILDLVTSFTVKAVDPFDSGLAGTHFGLAGGRLLGIHPTTGVKTYSYSNTSLTASTNGEYVFSSQSPGLYTFTLNSPSTNKYEFFKMLPDNTVSQNITDIAPGFSGTVKAVLLDKEIGSVKIQTLDNDTNEPLEGVNVRLENSAASYDITASTDKFGWVYFPQANTPLADGDYTITATMTSFDTKTDSVTLTGTLQTKVLELDPS